MVPVQDGAETTFLSVCEPHGLANSTKRMYNGAQERRAPVFGPFRLGDGVRVYRLQRRGTSLDLEGDLLRPHTPLWEAWLALVTQHAMGEPAYVLYDPHEGEAFVQIRYRPHQDAADVAYISPSLAVHPRASTAWATLLDGACVDVAERGIQRVFAKLPESGVEVEVFRQAGFTPYAGEEIYRLGNSENRVRGRPGLALRPQRLDDWPAVQKLGVAVIPQRVRQVEGGIALATDKGGTPSRYVLPGERGDDLAAVLTLYRGGLASWVSVLVHPDAGHFVVDLLQWALAALADGPARPIYCSTRKYEGGMRPALESCGFDLVATRVLMVRHTAAWVKAASQELVPVLKGGAEPVPPAFHINAEAELQPSNGWLAVTREPQHRTLSG
jgi:hypothetical protein